MITIKTEEEIGLLRENNLLVSATLAEVAKHVAPGVTTLELDRIAEEFIRSHGAVPGFLGYGGFPNTLCISVNEQVVHGIPSDYALREGDVVSVDCGTVMKGFYGDSAYTFAVGSIDPQVAKLLQVTKEALYKGVAQAKAGNRVGDISAAVQQHAESNGFSVVRELVGHGLGRDMHEDPEVPNYGARGRGPLLKEGGVREGRMDSTYRRPQTFGPFRICSGYPQGRPRRTDRFRNYRESDFMTGAGFLLPVQRNTVPGRGREKFSGWKKI